MRNHVKLITGIGDLRVSHFSLHEFANEEGVVVLDDTLLIGLELLRNNLNSAVPDRAECSEICIRVTDGTRTESGNKALAATHGWTDDVPAGKVSRNSKHLVRHGGIAADIYAYHSGFHGEEFSVDKDIVAQLAEKYFDYVKSDYGDGHIHIDQRAGGEKLRERGYV